jgi:hypothetical protein
LAETGIADRVILLVNRDGLNLILATEKEFSKELHWSHPLVSVKDYV